MGIRPNSAHAAGTQFVKRPQVIAELARLREKLIVRTGRSLEEIVAKIETIGFAEANSLIADSVDHVKNADRLKALELLLRLKGAFVDKVELTGRGGGPITTLQLSWVAMITAEREKIKYVQASTDVPFLELPQDAKESSDGS